MEYNESSHSVSLECSMSSRHLVGPDLLELLYPAPQSVHLGALMAGLALQLRDGLLLLGAVELDLL